MPRDDRTIDQQSVSRESVASAAEETAGLPGTTASDDRPPFAPPTTPGDLGQLGKYRILKELGRGGMGAVYLAHDERLRRKVALKVMLPKFAANAEAKSRFLREARAAAQISSDYVVSIYEADEIDGIPFIALQFLQGMALDEFLKTKGPLAPAQICRIGREAALGLAAAHQLGLVHRDIKPGNLWLEAPNGRVKILDFGLAKAVEGESVDLTGSGMLVGTPVYMSPEQARGEKVDGRTDLYSLGGVLYRLCTGNVPVKGATPMAVLTSLAVDTPTPIHEINPSIPASLAALTHQLLSKDAAKRPATAQDLAARLMQITKELTTPAILAAAPVSAQPMAPAPASNPFAELTTGESDSLIPARKTAPTRTLDAEPIAPRRRPPLSWLVGGGLTLLALILVAGGIIITIRNKDGTVTEIKVPPGAKVEVNGKPVEPEPRKEATPATFKNSLGMEFVKVPKGTAWLGGGGGKQGETKVVIEQDFYLGKYEVTQEEWEKVTGLNPSHFSRNGAGKDAVKEIPDADLKRFPVEMVSWDDCQLFIKRLNEKAKDTGWVYRLPKAAEWEYVCRGGPVDKLDSAFDFYFAKLTNTLKPEQANFAPAPGKGLQRTCKVGSYEPSVLGFYDMHGNVWGWCEDSLPPSDPKEASRRMIRGGAWSGGSDFCRAAQPEAYPQSQPDNHLGLRLARVPVVPAPVAADPDRKAAEYVLSIGGTVHVDGKEQVLKAVAELPKEPFQLLIVDLYDNKQVDDAGMAHFAECKNVAVLTLHGTNVSDVGLAHFKNYRNLKHLSLGLTKLSDAGLANFKDCSELTYLELNGTNVSDVGFRHLKDCKSLVFIALRQTPIGDSGMAYLRAFTKLEKLDLHSSTQVGDAGIKHVKDCKALTALDLQSTKVTAAMVAELRKALPKCRIGSDHGTFEPK